MDAVDVSDVGKMGLRSPAEEMSAAELAYLREKWRKDSSDPATGLGTQELRTELDGLMAGWVAEGSWEQAKGERIFVRLKVLPLAPT